MFELSRREAEAIRCTFSSSSLIEIIALGDSAVFRGGAAELVVGRAD